MAEFLFEGVPPKTRLPRYLGGHHLVYLKSLVTGWSGGSMATPWQVSVSIGRQLDLEGNPPFGHDNMD